MTEPTTEAGRLIEEVRHYGIDSPSLPYAIDRILAEARAKEWDDGYDAGVLQGRHLERADFARRIEARLVPELTHYIQRAGWFRDYEHARAEAEAFAIQFFREEAAQSQAGRVRRGESWT